jgi:hypothetical protein
MPSLSLAEIEAKKDKFDLKPCIDFVSQHKSIYEKNILKLQQLNVSVISPEVDFIGEEKIIAPQLYSSECLDLLRRMPPILSTLTKLKQISYITFGNEHVIPIPGFDKEGNFDACKVELVNYNEFPRENDHPSRVLVGVSNGETIYPTPIPFSVSADQQAISYYQIHVFLHEFFHTIGYPARKDNERANIILYDHYSGNAFSFQQWWEDFERLILSRREPEFISNYASNYADRLNQKVKESDPISFEIALSEQICETFVAYMLNIVPNRRGWTDFRLEDFGNYSQLEKFNLGNSVSANEKYLLMSRLLESRLVGI